MGGNNDNDLVETVDPVTGARSQRCSKCKQPTKGHSGPYGESCTQSPSDDVPSTVEGVHEGEPKSDKLREEEKRYEDLKKRIELLDNEKKLEEQTRKKNELRKEIEKHEREINSKKYKGNKTKETRSRNRHE